MLILFLQYRTLVIISVSCFLLKGNLNKIRYEDVWPPPPSLPPPPSPSPTPPPSFVSLHLSNDLSVVFQLTRRSRTLSRSPRTRRRWWVWAHAVNYDQWGLGAIKAFPRGYFDCRFDHRHRFFELQYWSLRGWRQHLAKSCWNDSFSHFRVGFLINQRWLVNCVYAERDFLEWV